MNKRCFVLLVYSLLFAACENDKLIELTEQCEFHENLLGSCFSGIGDCGYDEIVITDSESYQHFGNVIRIHPVNVDCDTAALPYIDFNGYTLLGKRTSGGGCSAYYDRKIFKDKKDKRIIYKIEVQYGGACAMLIGSWNWISIPKLLEGYSVEFKVNQSYR